MSASFSPKLRKWLMASGCRFVRQAKGAHEIWFSPLTRRRFVMAHAIKSRRTVLSILRRAGVAKPGWLGGPRGRRG